MNSTGAQQLFKDVNLQSPQSRLQEKQISVSLAAKLLGVSRDSVYRLIEDGTLRAYQHRGHGWWHVMHESVLRQLDRTKKAGKGE
jgi:excisionase family DNA binding protein